MYFGILIEMEPFDYTLENELSYKSLRSCFCGEMIERKHDLAKYENSLK